MKLKIKLNTYILSFFLLIFIVMLIDDIIKYKNYKNTLIDSFSDKYIKDTQQIREGYRLLFDKLQYDFGQAEAKNIKKINQLFEIYKRDHENFDIEQTVDELNKDVSFGKYQVFLINKAYIIENASYKKDIGWNLGQYKVFSDLFTAMFDKKIALDISPITLDSGSMQFKRYLLKQSHDGKYLLQIAFVLDVFEEMKEKYNSFVDRQQLDLFLANENFIQWIDLEKPDFTKKTLPTNWAETKHFLSSFSNDLIIKSKSIASILNSKNNEENFKINNEIDKLFNDEQLLYSLNLSKHQLSIYTITDGLYNKLNDTKLLIKVHYSTHSLEEDLQKTFNQTIFPIFIILLIFTFIYLFIVRIVSNKLLKIIDNIKNNQYSAIDDIKTIEISTLNNSYNVLHKRLNNEIKLNKNLLNDNKRFIADTVHQIRTPLTNIMMNAEMVKKFQKDNSLSTFIDKIDSSINMLSNSYEDLAYITTSDTINYSPTTLNISEILNNRIKFFSTISKVNYKEIISNIDDELFININAIELERLIDNNISNGIKYGSKNKLISINLSKTANKVTLTFKTFGDEINNKERVFDKNYRENDAKRGLGLGLNMVKGICEKYHLSYDVSYTDGQNIFTYTFKAQ